MEEIGNLLNQLQTPIIASPELQRPNNELLENMAQTPKWLIQWCILRSSTGCNKCHQKLEAIQQFEASEQIRKAELERIAKKNDMIKSINEMIKSKIDMMKAQVDTVKIQNQKRKRTPYILGSQKQIQDRRTSSWKSIFDKPIFDAFKK